MHWLTFHSAIEECIVVRLAVAVGHNGFFIILDSQKGGHMHACIL